MIDSPPGLTGYDASTPPATPPVTDWALVYAGGNTPHVWTDAEIYAQGARALLPTWVALGTGEQAGRAEAAGMLAWLSRHHVPPGSLVLADFEARAAIGEARAYSDHFCRALARRGYPTVIYGSLDTILSYPLLHDTSAGFTAPLGYAVADWTGVPHLFDHRNVLITQYRPATGAERWDLDLAASHLLGMLWQPWQRLLRMQLDQTRSHLDEALAFLPRHLL